MRTRAPWILQKVMLIEAKKSERSAACPGAAAVCRLGPCAHVERARGAQTGGVLPQKRGDKREQGQKTKESLCMGRTRVMGPFVKKKGEEQ